MKKLKKEREKNLQPRSQGSLLPALRSIEGSKVQRVAKSLKRKGAFKYRLNVELESEWPLLKDTMYSNNNMKWHSKQA